MSAMWFGLALSDGSVACGPVQGSGGLMGAGTAHLGPERRADVEVARLRRQVALAEAGLPLHVYEPEPGCVMVYPEYGPGGNGPGRVVSLVGAEVTHLDCGCGAGNLCGEPEHCDLARAWDATFGS